MTECGEVGEIESLHLLMEELSRWAFLLGCRAGQGRLLPADAPDPAMPKVISPA